MRSRGLPVGFAIVAGCAAAGTASAFEVAKVVAPPVVEAPAGQTRHVAIEVIVEPGYHVQANPAALPNLIPTAIAVSAPPGVTVGAPRYPAPKRMRLAGGGTELLVLDGRFVVEVPITRVRQGAEAATSLRLDGRLTYQGCDDRRCFFPRTTTFVLDVVARDPGPPPSARR